MQTRQIETAAESNNVVIFLCVARFCSMGGSKQRKIYRYRHFFSRTFFMEYEINSINFRRRESAPA